jgi:hypothetical protein
MVAPSMIVIILYGIRWFLSSSLQFIVGAIIRLLLTSTISTNLGFGQVFPKSQASVPIKSNKSPSSLSLTQQPNAYNVKITSPTKGEKVLAGKNLTISGISAGNSNPTSINRHVSIIVNGIKPYRPATATGPNESGDYSKWSFTLTPNYTTIKATQNKITARYSSANDAASLSRYSVNVTGVTATNVNNTAARVK